MASHPTIIQLKRKENGISILCYPSHNTQTSLPLNRSFFEPFKTFCGAEIKNWMLSNQEFKISWLVTGKQTDNARIKVATSFTAISRFTVVVFIHLIRLLF